MHTAEGCGSPPYFLPCRRRHIYVIIAEPVDFRIISYTVSHITILVKMWLYPHIRSRCMRSLLARYELRFSVAWLRAAPLFYSG